MHTYEQNHWDQIYSTKTQSEFSWFQPYPKTSMDFLELFHLPLDARIIDIGGGDSHFVDALLEKGYRNIWVLDISEKALERTRMRLGEKAALVHWVHSDILDFDPPVLFNFWHDRAAFHFLTTEDKIEKYVSLTERSIRKDGYLILGTFCEQGPQRCSGLEVRRYSKASMSVHFEDRFKRIKCIEEDHTTPFHTHQHFVFCSFQKR